MNEPADVMLLPGESGATAGPEDVAHWIDVYTELVGFCRSAGIVHERFEQRLAHWRELGGRNGNGNGAASLDDL